MIEHDDTMPSDHHRHDSLRRDGDGGGGGGGEGGGTGTDRNDDGRPSSDSSRRRLRRSPDRRSDPRPPAYASHRRRKRPRRPMDENDVNDVKNDDGRLSRSKSSSSSSTHPHPPHRPPSKSSAAASAAARTSDDRIAASSDTITAATAIDATITAAITRRARPTWAPTPTSYPWYHSSSSPPPPPCSSTSIASASRRLGPDDAGGDTAAYGTCDDVSARYRKVDRIGEGTYGVVYRAIDRRSGDVVALKRCLPHHESTDGFPLTTLREITILRELDMTGGRDHCIIGLRDVTVSSGRSGVFLVFDYAHHDLATLVDDHHAKHGRSPFQPSEVKRLTMQLLDALHFLHSRHILHRDLKLSNLLYDQRGMLRVADFGLARRVGGSCISSSVGAVHRRSRRRTGVDDDGDVDFDDIASCRLTPKVVSLWYRPPELLLGAERYDQGVDTWGAGCVMGELLRGRPLMDGRTEMDQLSKMFAFLGPPNSDDWPGLHELPLLKSGEIEIPKRRQMNNDGLHLLDVFRDWGCPPGIRLLMGLLKYDPSTRLTAAEALLADYFTTPPAPTPLSLMPTFPTKHSKLSH